MNAAKEYAAMKERERIRERLDSLFNVFTPKVKTFEKEFKL